MILKIQWVVLWNFMFCCLLFFSCLVFFFSLPTAQSTPGSRVSCVGSGHGCCIYGLGRFAALIRQHKRGRIESLMTRGIFHRSPPPPFTCPHRSRSEHCFFFFSPPPPCERINRGQAGFSKLTPSPPSSLCILSRGRFKGHATRNSRITRLTK